MALTLAMGVYVFDQFIGVALGAASLSYYLKSNGLLNRFENERHSLSGPLVDDAARRFLQEINTNRCLNQI